LLGACTSVALQSSAATDKPTADTDADADAETPAAAKATVVALDDAPSATAPNGKATITHLALGQNAYLGRLRMEAGGAVPVHHDSTEEYIHVLEGAGTMTIDGTAYEIGPGATIYMPANAEVSYQNGDQEMVALQVFAGPEPAAKYEAWTTLGY
jgi:quercetin dioxygenase-like cupin family protein